MLSFFIETKLKTLLIENIYNTMYNNVIPEKSNFLNNNLDL